MNGKVGLTALGRRLLEQFRLPRQINFTSDAALTQEQLDTLLRVGLLALQGQNAPPTDYVTEFQGWKSQRGMLIDRARTMAFQNAIKATVCKGDLVIDVGAGSGILSMISARAGASKVYALEFTTIVNDARQIALDNGLSCIEFIQGDASAFKADEQVDLIVSEFAGMYLLDEWRHFSAFTQVRDTNLKIGGSVIPRASAMYLSAVDSRRLYVERGFGFWESPIYDFDFSHVLNVELGGPRREIVQAEHNSLVDTVKVASIDFLIDTVSVCFFEKDLEFIYPVDGICHGFIGHFDLEMTPGIFLSTGTLSRQTHWHQSYFPIRACEVKAGERICIKVRTFLASDTEAMCLGIRVKSKHKGNFEGEYVYMLE